LYTHKTEKVEVAGNTGDNTGDNKENEVGNNAQEE
jgi:hypothetical protein